MFGKTRSQRLEAASGGKVDLLAYPALIVILALLLLLAIAVVVDLFVLPPIRALWSPDYGLAAIAGASVAIGAYVAIRRAPRRERIVMALLLGAGVGLFWHSLSARTGVLMHGEPETVQYYAGEAPGVFRPLDARYPVMHLDGIDVPEYWESVYPDSRHEFVLLRAGAERYALSLPELYERIGMYYSLFDADY